MLCACAAADQSKAAAKPKDSRENARSKSVFKGFGILPDDNAIMSSSELGWSEPQVFQE
jgi:hypothetical protein